MSGQVPPVPPQAAQPQDQSNGLAIVSLVLAIFSWFCLTIFGSVPAVICGHIALSRQKGNGLAIAGLVVGYSNIAASVLMLPLIVAIMLPALTRAQEAAKRSSCSNNLKQMGLVCMMVANESQGGVYPELSPEAGNLMLRGDEAAHHAAVYPEYLENMNVLHCPSDVGEATGIDNHSYTYLGYAVTNEEELEAFAEAYKARIEEGGGFENDLPMPVGAGGEVIPRLRQDLEIPLAMIPVMWDNVGFRNLAGEVVTMVNHIPGGGNVLYADGHVEYVKYQAKFPYTERAARILSELNAMGQ